MRASVGIRFPRILLAAGLVMGCTSLPPVSFVAGDGGSGATGSLDSGRGSDGAVLPSLDGAPSPVEGGSGPDADAGEPDAACPATPPPGTSACCGAIPCSGDAKKCQAACVSCEDSCNLGQTCCIGSNGTLSGCVGSASECP